MSTLQNTDMLIVERATVPYKASYADVTKGLVKEAPDGTADGTKKYVRQIVTLGTNQTASWVEEATGLADAPDGTADGTIQYVRQVARAGTTDTKTWVALSSYLPTAGGNLTGGVTQTERTITTKFDLATGNFWTCGAIAIPAATNGAAGMSGLIRLTAAPTGWNTMFKHAGGTATAPKAFPAIVPFYVVSATEILVGKPVEGMA